MGRYDSNLIVVSIYTRMRPLNDEEKEYVIELASTLIEFKPDINHRIDFFVFR